MSLRIWMAQLAFAFVCKKSERNRLRVIMHICIYKKYRSATLNVETRQRKHRPLLCRIIGLLINFRTGLLYRATLVWSETDKLREFIIVTFCKRTRRRILKLNTHKNTQETYIKQYFF